jgi:hypothetical protein
VRFLGWGIRQGFFDDTLDVELVGTLISGGYDRLAREVVRGASEPDFEALLGEVHRSLVHKVLFVNKPSKRTGGRR